APVALQAQRPDPLGQLVAEALRTNLGLEGERLAERRATAEVREARGLFFPSLGLQSRYSRLGGVPNIGDLINPAYATLNQLAGAARQLAADVQVAYLQDASARRAVEIYEATLVLVLENERVAERLLGAGSATPEAVFRARAERADVEQQLAEARERRLAASRALNRIVRRPLDAPVEVVPDSVVDRLPRDIT